MHLSTASAQSCQQLGVFLPSFGWFARFFGGFSLVWVFRLVCGFLAGFRGLRLLGSGGLLTGLEPICHLDDIVQCLRWLITTADTRTAPERVFHTCTYFSFLNLWSEWELAGRNFSAILKM